MYFELNLNIFCQINFSSFYSNSRVQFQKAISLEIIHFIKSKNSTMGVVDHPLVTFLIMLLKRFYKAKFTNAVVTKLSTGLNLKTFKIEKIHTYYRSVQISEKVYIKTLFSRQLTVKIYG